MRVSATDRKAQLIDAAIEVMRRDGVASMTLRAVAKAANASLATVHYCFADKDELLQRAIERWLGEMLERGPQTDTDSGLRACVMRLAQNYWQFLEDTPSDTGAQLEMVIWTVRNDVSGDLRESIYQGYEHALSKLFAEAAELAGERSRMEYTHLARAFIAIIDGSSLQYLTQPDRTCHQKIFLQLIDSLIEWTLITADAAVVSGRASA